jgi:translation initiation factor 2B subunit (eIF-2B alpha/beta/delta family)
MEKSQKRFNKICNDIKHLKIQGAESVAIAGLKAYKLVPTEKAIRKLLSLRATEPALRNSLRYAKKFGVESALKHFSDSEQITNKLVHKIIKNNSAIFTHCHSTSVIDSLIYAKEHGKNFQVYNTETRPLYQGRKTAKELARAGIDVTTMVDAAARIGIKKADMMMIGCDAILNDGSVINKIGSGIFAQIAYHSRVPIYIITDSWKFSPQSISIEERNFKEIWKRIPKRVKVINPAFERVKARYITAIISELGILKPNQFAKEVKKNYPQIF